MTQHRSAKDIEADIWMAGGQLAAAPAIFEIIQDAVVLPGCQAFPLRLSHQKTVRIFRVRADKNDFGKFIPIPPRPRMHASAPILEHRGGMRALLCMPSIMFPSAVNSGFSRSPTIPLPSFSLDQFKRKRRFLKIAEKFLIWSSNNRLHSAERTSFLL